MSMPVASAATIAMLGEVLRTSGELHIHGDLDSEKEDLAMNVAEAMGLPTVDGVHRYAGQPTAKAVEVMVKCREGTPFVHVSAREAGVQLPVRVRGELRIVVPYEPHPSLGTTPTVVLGPLRQQASGLRVSGFLHLPSGETRPLPDEAATQLPGLLTPDTLAETLGVSTKTLDRWRRGGEGPAFVQVGASVRYRDTDVDAWIAANRTDPAA